MVCSVVSVCGSLRVVNLFRGIKGPSQHVWHWNNSNVALRQKDVFSCWWRLLGCFFFWRLKTHILQKHTHIQRNVDTNTNSAFMTHIYTHKYTHSHTHTVQSYLHSSSCQGLVHILDHRHTWSYRECLHTSVHIHHCLAWHTHLPLKQHVRARFQTFKECFSLKIHSFEMHTHT